MKSKTKTYNIFVFFLANLAETTGQYSNERQRKSRLIFVFKTDRTASAEPTTSAADARPVHCHLDQYIRDVIASPFHGSVIVSWREKKTIYSPFGSPKSCPGFYVCSLILPPRLSSIGLGWTSRRWHACLDESKPWWVDW